MRQEWREFWYWTARRSVYPLWAFPVSLLFFLAALPTLSRAEYLRNISISLGFGLLISGSIWLVFTLAWAGIVLIGTKTGRWYRPNLLVNALLGSAGSLSGLYLALLWRARALGTTVTISRILPDLMLGFFISLGFLFFFAYGDARRENDKLKAASAEASYHALKSQMQPHFLFNSLNSLSQLIATNQDQASEMTQKLADLYREILRNSKSKTASLQSEMAIARRYLKLERLRFGDRLRYAIEEPPGAEKIHVPSLMLQTLVENALKHGIAKRIEGGEVMVGVIEKENGYEIAVENSGEWDGAAGKGTGLENTRARLELLYGKAGYFEFSSGGGRTVARYFVSGEPIA